MLADDPDALPDGYVPLGRLHALAGTPAPQGREFAPSTETMSGLLIALSPVPFVPLMLGMAVVGVAEPVAYLLFALGVSAASVALAVADLRALDDRGVPVRVSAVAAVVPLLYLVLRARSFERTDWTPRRLVSIHVVGLVAVGVIWQVFVPFVVTIAVLGAGALETWQR